MRRASSFRMRRAPLRAYRHLTSRVGMNPTRDDNGDAPLRAPNTHAGRGAPLRAPNARAGRGAPLRAASFRMRRATLRVSHPQAPRVGMNPTRDDKGHAPLRAPNARAGR